MRPKIYKIDGPPADVSKGLGIPVIDNQKPESQERNLDHIKKDYPRSTYIDPNSSYDDFYQLWLRAAAQKNYCFIQGDTMGDTIPPLFYHFFCISKKSNQENALLNRKSLINGSPVF